MKKLHVAFLWHMHQPMYRDIITGFSPLPWVRLHAVKGYYDMISVALKHDVQVTFNLVPALIRQLEEYANGATDYYLDITLKEADSLTEEEAVFLLANFFTANWDTMIKPNLRYGQLLEKRGFPYQKEAFKVKLKEFSTQELRDIQVWFNLAWFGFTARKDELVRELLKKGENFTEEEKRLLIDKQFEIIKKLLPLYKEAQEEGKVEISTSPYYHPILPLLCDVETAREAIPHAILPRRRFTHPEDALAQIRRGFELCERHFAKRPRGLWPPEGAVGDVILPILEEAGVEWIATDQAILKRSLGGTTPRYAHFKPYRVGNVVVFFRDTSISDAIGFVYSRNPTEVALEDLLYRINAISKGIGEEKMVVTIALDGENPWEHFPDGGEAFLNGLYTLMEERVIEPIKFSDAVREFEGDMGELTHLHAGSWINADFSIWIGEREDNIAWDALSAAREQVAKMAENVNKEALDVAFECLYAAEGSDWFWWYGTHFTSLNRDTFDEIFRRHVANVYKALGEEIPFYLESPITSEAVAKLAFEPIAVINPVLDGESTSYYEWVAGGYYEPKRGTMEREEAIIKGVYFGFDLANFYLRIDTRARADNLTDREILIMVLSPEQMEIKAPFKTGQVISGDKVIGETAVGKVVEMKIPFINLKANPGDEVRFVVTIRKEDMEVERAPESGYLSFIVPDDEYELTHWVI